MTTWIGKKFLYSGGSLREKPEVIFVARSLAGKPIIQRADGGRLWIRSTTPKYSPGTYSSVPTSVTVLEVEETELAPLPQSEEDFISEVKKRIMSALFGPSFKPEVVKAIKSAIEYGRGNR